MSEHFHQHKELFKNISEMLTSAGKETRLFDSKLLVIVASRVFENTAANFLGKLRSWLQVQDDPERMPFLKGKDLRTVPVKQVAQLLQTKL